MFFRVRHQKMVHVYLLILVILGVLVVLGAMIAYHALLREQDFQIQTAVNKLTGGRNFHHIGKFTHVDATTISVNWPCIVQLNIYVYFKSSCLTVP